ncbi:MAG: hypothetical protein NTZ56_20145 [Acidobacteria bacterium]|nr:hypothetical protein [Acidobacteriota bacterium]
MANLRLLIDAGLLKDARKLAADRHTNVNEIVRQLLEAQVDQASARRQAKHRLLTTRFPAAEITWTRDELYSR